MWDLSILTDKNMSQEMNMFLHWHRLDCTQLKGTTDDFGAIVNTYAIAQLNYIIYLLQLSPLSNCICINTL